MSHPLSGQEVLFTRQRHEADKMGLHWDYRFVLGDKAYSWATKKEMPEPGKSILLFEQPIHDREYALSKKVVIPKGNYGAGTTYLDWVHKAKVDGYEDEPDKLVINTKNGQKFLLKKLTSGKYFEQYGNKAWLFRNLTGIEKKADIPTHYQEGPDSTYTHAGYTGTVDSLIRTAEKVKARQIPIKDLDWIFADAKVDPKRIESADISVPIIVTEHKNKKTVLDGTHRLYKAKSQGLQEVSAKIIPDPYLYQSKFTPDLTPKQMEILGVLRHKGSQYGEGTGKDNFFGVRASMDAWPDTWHNEEHPQGWYQWYKGYSDGKRTDDDARQIKRWISFKARHLAQLQKADPTLSDLSIQPKRRQALLNWGIAPGIDVEKEVENKVTNKYLTKIASDTKDGAKDGAWYKKFKNPAAMLGTLVLGGVASVPVAAGANHFAKATLNSIDKADSEIADIHTVRKFMRDNGLKGKVKLKNSPTENRFGARNPHYVHRGIVNNFLKSQGHKDTTFDHSYIAGLRGRGINHGITMHELGHAKDFEAMSERGALIRGKAKQLGKKFSPILSIGLSTHKDTEKYAPIAASIPLVNNLVDEGRANYFAHQGIKAHKGKVAANKFLKKVVSKNMFNYGLAGAVPVVSTIATNKIYKGLESLTSNKTTSKSDSK